MAKRASGSSDWTAAMMAAASFFVWSITGLMLPVESIAISTSSARAASAPPRAPDAPTAQGGVPARARAGRAHGESRGREHDERRDVAGRVSDGFPSVTRGDTRVLPE